METAVIERFNPLCLAIILSIGLATTVILWHSKLSLWDKLLLLFSLTLLYFLAASFEYYRVKTVEEAL